MVFSALLGGLALVAALFCGLLHMGEVFAMQSEINQRLPLDQQFDPIFWTPGKKARLQAIHKQYFLDSERPKKAKLYFVLGMVFGCIGAIGLLGWFSHGY